MDDSNESKTNPNISATPSENNSTSQKNFQVSNKRKTDENSNLRRSKRIKELDRITYEEIHTSLDKYLLIALAQSIVCKISSSFQEIDGLENKHEWMQAVNEELLSLNQNDA